MRAEIGDRGAVHTGERVVAAMDFDAFVVARSSGLLRTAYLLTRDHALAEDLLQTALTKAWFAWSRLEGRPEPYVRKILVNTYASWWRRKWNGEHATEELPEPVSTDDTERVAAGHDLWAAMERLPRRQRIVVVLRYFEDLTEVETAHVMGCSVGTVKSQTSKAFAKLRIDPALAADDTAANDTPAVGATARTASSTATITASTTDQQGADR